MPVCDRLRSPVSHPFGVIVTLGDKGTVATHAAITIKLPFRKLNSILCEGLGGLATQPRSPATVASGVGPLQWAVISYLNNHDGEPGIDQNGLAARLGIDRSHASLLVEELHANGLVERRLNGADRRVRLLHLTAKGEKLHRRLRPANRAATDRILEPLAPHERELLVDMLIRIIGANGAHARPGSGRRKRGSQQSPSNESTRSPSDKN
jgi:DNA-binding MarR family transcriptional regulator